MTLRLAPELALRPIPGDDDETPRSELVLHGSASGQPVEGTVLEAAVACGERYLVFTTDDVPYEEVLHINLLDHALHTVDAASIGAPYSTGSFRALELAPPNEVHFRFMGDTRWTVELFTAARWTIAALSDPRGVSRPTGLRRWFALRGDPRPGP